MCGIECAFLDDGFSKFKIDSDHPFGSHKEVVHYIKLLIFKSQHLETTQHLTQIIDIDSQPKILPKIIHLAVQIVFKNRYDPTMHILGIVELVSAVKGRDLFHIVLFLFMLVYLSCYMVQSRNITTHHL